MRLLLDTHCFLWLNDRPERLGPMALSACQDPGNPLYLSLVSLWEIEIKQHLGKLALKAPWRQMLSRQQADNGLRTLPISLSHIEQLAQLPMHHRDPFDRMLIAQARVEGMALVSVDGAMASYDVEVVW
jgi:PIN domain nuclease of toxin-antitoxin system